MLSIAMESYVHETLSYPNLIFQLDKLEEEDQVTFVLPYMSGGDLLDAIAPEQGLPRDMAVLYSKQLLAAVAYLHGNGLAHRYVHVMCHPCSATRTRTCSAPLKYLMWHTAAGYNRCRCSCTHQQQ
jgi:hypothetical protein